MLRSFVSCYAFAQLIAGFFLFNGSELCSCHRLSFSLRAFIGSDSQRTFGISHRHGQLRSFTVSLSLGRSQRCRLQLGKYRILNNIGDNRNGNLR